MPSLADPDLQVNGVQSSIPSNKRGAHSQKYFFLALQATLWSPRSATGLWNYLYPNSYQIHSNRYLEIAKKYVSIFKMVENFVFACRALKSVK